MFFAIAIIASLSMISCSSGSSDEPSSASFKDVTFAYTLTTTQATIDALNIKISYYSVDGKELSETVTGTTWTKTFTATSVPAKSGYKVTMSKKETAPVLDKYDISINLKEVCSVNKTNDDVFTFKSTGFIRSNTGILKDKLSDWIDKCNAGSDASGSLSATLTNGTYSITNEAY